MAKKLTVNPQKICTCERQESKFIWDVKLAEVSSYELKLSQDMPHRSFYLHFRLQEIIYSPPSEKIPLS